jgi:hypothetical protein
MTMIASRLPILLAAGLAMAFSACHTVESKRLQFPDQPIAVKVINKIIDEDTLEYAVKFRNTGNDVISFDYTIADEPGVPHVDADGPNSGLIENLYPGAEVEVKNPLNRMAVFVTHGRVTHGRKTGSELQAIYRPHAPVAAMDALAPDALPGLGTELPTP